VNTASRRSKGADTETKREKSQHKAQTVQNKVQTKVEGRFLSRGFVHQDSFLGLNGEARFVPET